MERIRIILKGDVQTVGFRSFVTDQMISLGLKGQAENLPKGDVELLCEGEKEGIEELVKTIKENPPHFARVDSVDVQWQEYVGDLKEPERKGGDVPKEATLGDLLVVLKSFDGKAEVLNERVGGMASDMKNMSSTLKEFKEESGKKQDQMLDKQDQMLDKQDQTIKSINKGFTETKQDFNHMDTKYDKISDKMESMDKTLKKLTEALLKLVEKSTK